MEELVGPELKNLDPPAATPEPQPRAGILEAIRAARDGAEPVSRLVTVDRERRRYFYVSARCSQNGGEERRLVAMAMELTAAVDAADLSADFVRQVRHDLRSPLTSLHGGIELLLTERLGRLEEAQKRLLGVMQKAAHKMAAMLSSSPAGTEPASGPESAKTAG
jgi:signal transduction histidine kinase